MQILTGQRQQNVQRRGRQWQEPSDVFFHTRIPLYRDPSITSSAFSSRLGWRQLWIEQQGKELSAHPLPARNHGDALEQWFIRIRHDAITNNVNHRGAPRGRRIVLARTVQ